ncbi:hypothetical protein [Isoptericola croceus]|uniref:hypothetical protein n=1 Tax=Isoptericola croceus TaxID=3031406 RepID=UPI0023F8B9D9|nr:hypothetical protein [Isoptericola croceus]
MNKLKLDEGWNTLWSALTGAVPTLQSILAVLATALAVWAVISFINGKRNNRANPKQLGWLLALAALLALPNFIIPLLLRLLSFVLNFIIGLFGGFA